MPEAVDAVLDRDPKPGDVFALNDPFAGGTHLPDVTLVSPIAPDSDGPNAKADALDTATDDGSNPILGYAVSRAHHADVGGMAPGSMRAGARYVYQEGLRIPPTRLVADGETDEETESLLLANVRNPDERRADLRAQVAANERAEARVGDLLADHGDRLLAVFDAVVDYSRGRVESELADLPDGTYRASDAVEGDGVTDDDIPVEVAVTVDGATVEVDFAGTADQVTGNVNAPLTVAKSAVYFVIRCITDPEVGTV